MGVAEAARGRGARQPRFSSLLKIENGDERRLSGTLNLYELIKCTCYKIGSSKEVCLQRLWMDPPDVEFIRMNLVYLIQNRQLEGGLCATYLDGSSRGRAFQYFFTILTT